MAFNSYSVLLEKFDFDPSVSTMEPEFCPNHSDVLNPKFSALQRAQEKFRKACIQINVLNKQLDDLTDRYSKAKSDNFLCLSYNLRLKLAVIEGVRNMYYDYAYMKAEKVAELRHELFGETVDIIASDSETDED